MSKLTEKYVQEVSLNFLRNYYQTKNNYVKIFAKLEAATNYKKKRGRADGLIAFKTQDNNIYTVSLESKSHKTFNSLRTINENKGFFGVGLFFLIVMFSLTHFILNGYGWIDGWFIPVIISIILTILLLLLFQYNALFERHGIIEQVRRYPANERWISISKDALNFYNKLDDNELLYRAKKFNIGVLVVSPRKKVEILLESRSEKANKHTNYLQYYLLADKIKKELS